MPPHENPEADTDPGNGTRDRLFLLSGMEAGSLLPTEVARECMPTAYAAKQGAEKGTCWWWLRTPGKATDKAAMVSPDGMILGYGSNVVYDCAVRPAMWVRR